MAINLRDLNLPSLTRGEVMDARRKSRFPEDLTGNHMEAVTAYEYIPGEKGKGKGGKDISPSFQAKVKILESDNPLAGGREYTLRFWLGGDYQHYADRDRLAFVAACFGESSDAFTEGLTEAQAKEKALDKEQELVDASEKNELAPDEKGVYPCRIYHTRTCKTKQRAVLKNGKAEAEDVKFAQDYFSPVG